MSDSTGGTRRRRRFLGGSWWSWQGAVKIAVLLVLAIADVFLFLAVGRDADPAAQDRGAPSLTRTAPQPTAGRSVPLMAMATATSRPGRPEVGSRAPRAAFAGATRPSTAARTTATGATKAPVTATTAAPAPISTSATSTTTATPAPHTASDTSTTATSTATPAAPAPPAAGVATAPTVGGPAGAGTSGPGITEPGILLVATPRADGDLEVAEHVLLTAPTTALQLAPPAVGRAGPPFSREDPTALDVQASAGGQPVVVPAARVHDAVRVSTPPTREFDLRYRLTGVTVRSIPSTAGRALAAIGPLSAGLPANLPVVLLVRGATVLGINCPLATLDAQSCGIESDDGWRPSTSLPLRSALASVQFDLPMS